MRRSDAERKAFIRATAVALAAAVVPESEDWCARALFTTEECWERARELWKKKPDDC